MEENKEETRSVETDVPKKKKRKWPWILLVLLLLTCGGGYYAYVNDLLDPYIEGYGIAIPLHRQKEPDDVVDDPKLENGTQIVAPAAQKEYFDHALMNGKWVSEEDNPVYWELTFSAPEVTTDKKGVTGMIGDSDDERFQYKVVINYPEGQTVYYLDKVDDENARLWIPGSNSLYKGHVKLHLAEPATEVIDKPSNNSNTGNGSGHNSNGGGGNGNGNSGGTGTQSKGHWETRTEVVPAWDEQVLVTAGYYEEVLVSEAWDEEETYCTAFGYDKAEVYICNTCGAVFYDSSIYAHIDEEHGGGGGWHNDYVNVGEQHCLSYGTDIIHHPAVYDKVWHDPVYKTVHHPEETRTYQVWVED